MACTLLTGHCGTILTPHFYFQGENKNIIHLKTLPISILSQYIAEVNLLQISESIKLSQNQNFHIMEITISNNVCVPTQFKPLVISTFDLDPDPKSYGSNPLAKINQVKF